MADEVDERTLELVAALLEDAERFPWKTAPYLARRLAETRNVSVGPADLERALLEHAGRENRLIRYSFFPARKTLDLLWGHVRNVGDSAELPPVLLRPEADIAAMVGELEEPALPDDAPWCFLSHSFRDLQAVIALRDRLISRGYGVWIAEVQIEPGGMITEAVQKGLRGSDKLVAFMSPSSIGSRWVLKEISVAVHSARLPPVVIVDGTSTELIELFSAWASAAEGWPDRVAAAVTQLVSGDHDEHAATELPSLVVAGLGDVPPGERRAVVFPEGHRSGGHPCLTMEEAFPPPHER
jgi:hypothetical protein